jgi:predicted alpha/beta superfamily hydrolase
VERYDGQVFSSSSPLQGGTLTGHFVRHQIASKNLGATRGVTVRLPDNYDPEHKIYPVVYMHDGQNLFDSRTGFAGQEWHVDEVVDKLTHTGQMPESIIVAIDNANRFDEYTHVPDPGYGGGKGKVYENFLVDELMPAVESTYAVNPKYRMMLGSSLGGLVTTSIGIAHPALFAALGPMSSSAWWANGEIADRILKTPLEQGPKPRIWMDMGTEEGEDDNFGTREIGPDGQFGARPKQADQVQDVRNRAREAATALLAKGWVLDDNLRYHEPLGGQHNEHSWSERIGEVFTWLSRGMRVEDRPHES